MVLEHTARTKSLYIISFHLDFIQRDDATLEGFLEFGLASPLSRKMVMAKITSICYNIYKMTDFNGHYNMR